jgi:hypothetical protein
MTTEIDIYNGYEGLASLADHAGEIGAGLCKSPRLCSLDVLVNLKSYIYCLQWNPNPDINKIAR